MKNQDNVSFNDKEGLKNLYKYILISPNNEKFEFFNKLKLEKFIQENNMSIRLILKFINKGKITIKRHSKKTINTENWLIIREKYE